MLPASLIHALAGRDRSTIHRQLQFLWEHEWLNRFVFPGIKNPSENHYYIDNPHTLNLLTENGLRDRETLDFAKVYYHRQRPYTAIQERETFAQAQGRLLYANHELMISRFHAMLELSCRASGGRVELAAFRQGSELWDFVEAPRYTFTLGKDDEMKYRELDERERLPHRPDAFFTLRYPEKSGEDEYIHYFYEADRATENTTRFNRKLRAHFYYIVKQKKHREKYGVNRIRAVLIETVSNSWADTLYYGAQSQIVSGAAPTPLFWFTSSEIYAHLVTSARTRKDGTAYKQARPVPYYLEHPESLMFEKWFSSPALDRKLLSLFELSHFKVT